MALSAGFTASLPTNYEYYTSTGINSGLNANQSFFTLNDKLIKIYSGAMHYFRVPRPYWRDRLRKIRAAGLNTVETYVPWNLHEPENGKFDFGEGGSEFEDFLHLEEFLNAAKEEDLFVILRTGPYICSEYNSGGFPSWLLREKPMGFRTSEENYMKFVTRFFNLVLTLLAAFQFQLGGPVIAFQVENEYGNLENGAAFQPDKVYMEELRQLFLKNGIVELLTSADSPLWKGTSGRTNNETNTQIDFQFFNNQSGTLPGELFQTANFGDNAVNQLNKLEEFQPGRPLMVMEYWIGWFDNVGGEHSVKSDEDSRRVLEDIFSKNASFNAYMFHGGTNFWFNNGANLDNDLMDNSGYTAITTSYDYDAPISESGGYRNKYFIVKELVAADNPVQTFTPEAPEYIEPLAYESSRIEQFLPLRTLLEENSPISIRSEQLLPMEMLDINDGSGQNNGYIVYQKDNVDLEENSVLTIEGNVCDTVLVLVDGDLVAPTKLSSLADLDGFGYWRLKDSSVQINEEPKFQSTITLLVENMGRVHGAGIYQYNHTFKGLWQGNVTINQRNIYDWEVVPLELKKQWINELKGWSEFSTESSGPGMYKATLSILEEPRDTYIDTRGWGKGMVFVNGFALGRYAAIGPQFALYLPAPFLVNGDNSIIFFEHFSAPADGLIAYTDEQIFINPT
ncbi:hypothetical protein D910_06906 [Dendroctonus ponderosae]|uniref:Beta-galactosidase n=1 Tax=Dendroctonus ponderosae TaxID=77166 RepID=U4UG12_DENPD|nr:hypothetical protein D910_06906 [Dendroctonus ponderosae]